MDKYLNIKKDVKMNKLKQVLMNATPHQEIKEDVEALFRYIENLELFVECHSKKDGGNKNANY